MTWPSLSGELIAPAMESTGRKYCSRPGFLFILPWIVVSRPIVNQRSGLDHTGSLGKFLEETLGFLEINPRSLA
jgi:hypothetical protein